MCVASFFARVNERKLEGELKKKKKKGEGEEEGREFPNQEGRGRGRGKFSKGSVRAHKRRAKKPRERREKRGWRLSRLAPSVTRVVIFVSHAFRSAD